MLLALSLVSSVALLPTAQLRASTPKPPIRAALTASPLQQPAQGCERALQPTAFVFVLSVAIVALSPTQHIVDTLGAARGSRLLATVASASALCEICLAPVVGALSDSIGRKPVLLLTIASVLLVNAAAALVPSVPTLVASRFVCNLVVGLFFLSSGAMLGDAYRSDPARLAAVSGTIFAIVNGGFAGGIALSSLLPRTETLRWAYRASSAAALLALGIGTAAVRESMPPSQRVPFQPRQINPVSFVRLFRSGREMRLLACLLAVTLQPIFMGDVLQVFAIEEWGLAPPQVATLFTIIPVLGALGNIVGGRCVRWMGVLAFTALATTSNILFWAGCCFGHRAALVAAAIGFLGAARTLSVSTAITSLGGRLGIPQGQLSGDRSNLMAILKVIGPALYGQLYVRGKGAGLPQLPFVLNLLLTSAALALAPLALAASAAQDDERASGTKTD